MNLKDYIATIPDFPQEGILFRDITPLMAAPDAFQEACKRLDRKSTRLNSSH